MLNIEITKGNTSTGQLEFKVNGVNSRSGDGDAKKNWQVHWRVGPNTDVLAIDDIQMKSRGGSTDIFTADPPSPQDANNKHWKANVDDSAPDGVDYLYDIIWLSAKGQKIHDPKISIKP